MPLLSIIIPCYNSYSKLQFGLRRIEAQNHHELELIVVDDCSKDDSYVRLQEFAKNCVLNLKIFKNEENSGPGITRNNGLKFASGEYVTFMDSDDYFADNFFSTIQPLLNLKNECIIFDFIIKDGSEETPRSTIINREKGGNISPDRAMLFSRGAPWGKIYLKSIIDEQHIQFLAMKQNEDMPFTKMAIVNCANIIYVDKYLYYYVMEEGSLMHNDSLVDVNNTKVAFKAVYDRLHINFPFEIEALFIHEYLYSLGLTLLSKQPRSEWIASVSEAELMFPAYLKNKYLKEFPKYVQLIVYLIHFKMYWILKLVLKLRKIL